MISLTYISTATSPYDETELTELLSATRENNHAADLTGVLLYAGGHFIQTLEGPEDAVEETYGRIQRDRRHRNLDVALRDEITERIFPDWSMGFKSISPEQAAELPGFNDYLAGRTISPESRVELGRAGIFHRVFRRTMG
ncbi:BLUF domain-containing protein [Nocardioides houyundeii]|uniref:BLUF domain-containing protein n=1 Tax=Nocardioides houyundeii TaxID=2045452 RepID=UPI000C783788|nr:BLUF domain-containing protein [Nocardioides houyundeii]